MRAIGLGGQILSDLGIQRIRLLSNTPMHIPALEGFEEPEEVQPLAQMLLDPHAHVRNAAGEVLSELKETASAAPLLPMLQGGPAEVRALAYHAGIGLD